MEQTPSPLSETQPTHTTYSPHYAGLAIALLTGLVVGAAAYAFVSTQPKTPPIEPGPGAIDEPASNPAPLVVPVKTVELQQPDGTTVSVPVSDKDVAHFATFASEEEYVAYMQEARNYSGMSGRGMGASIDVVAEASFDVASPLTTTNQAVSMQTPDRYSATNVQVAGIDEPDMLKTNGEQIFFSPEPRYFARPMTTDSRMEILIAPGEQYPEYTPPTTKVLRGFPVDQLALESEIEATGDMLLHESMLAVFAGDRILGYDVSNREAPEEVWTVELEDRTSIVQARLFNGGIYLVSRTQSRSTPCPMPVYRVGGVTTEVMCTDVYRPDMVVPAETTYHVHVVNMADGTVTPGISFVGSYDATIYMSSAALYVAYGYAKSELDVFLGFVLESEDLFPASFVSKLTQLAGYDISDRAKAVEFAETMSTFLDSLDGDEGLALENELENRMEEYMKAHMRELTSTDVVKVDVNSFAVESLGTVPGYLLNQFSLDEYDGNLRVASTISDGGWNSMGNENDVYVLSADMDIVGSALGMGLDERIYSVRFIGDKGYVVTFRETDPFYVLDLSDPTKPAVTGELKIPGYSSYLHPITNDLILGIGKEDSNVKASLFDVSDPYNPVEASKYLLKEYWSDILNTHHAFLQDSRHQVFFLPGSQGGYVFSYNNNDISLVKAVSDIRARRALFIDDYLYIFGDDEVVVLDETSWERVKELTF